MAKKSKTTTKKSAKTKNKPKARPIQQYEHLDQERVNNPHIGLVNESTDTDYGQNKKIYQYDPHLDPQLQWTGKAERLSFEVPVVSLHVHERIDPKTIIDSAKRDQSDDSEQLSLFEKVKKPLREAIEFYKHKEGWTNRLISGDSLLVMNSLLEKEAMGGKVQMVYFDPPYGIKYGSNFQPFVNKQDVKDGHDDDLTQEPEMIKAFRDTWELGIHSYLSYLRDRLLLAKDLLNNSGSVFVQISDENVHRVRSILDEVFGAQNFVSEIVAIKSGALGSKLLSRRNDYILYYAKDISKVKYHALFNENKYYEKSDQYSIIEEKDGRIRPATKEEKQLPKLAPTLKAFRYVILTKPGPGAKYTIKFKGKDYDSGRRWWGFPKESLEKLCKLGRVAVQGNNLSGVRYFDDFPATELNNIWTDTGTGSGMGKVYVVQTSEKIIQRCILLSTDPSDLILDITCGSGTTAFLSEEWGRRWITCDTSRIALSLAKQRLMTANFNYFKLARSHEGVAGGFIYKEVPRITLQGIANNEPPKNEILFDQLEIDDKTSRVTGPFTVESIPAPFVKNLDDTDALEREADGSITRTGETLRQDQWRDELQRTGVRGKGGSMMQFSRIETQEGTRYIQAAGETKESRPQKVLIVFGPEHAPLDARVVELAIEEARQLKPHILLFCAFQFDEEAAKDIDETSEKLIGFKLLKAHMNMDLQTEDLKKQRNSNQSFWLIGQPDVRLHEITKGDDKGKVKIEVIGFDYYNPKTGAIDSGGSKNIAMWMLDTDYDGRSLFPRQIFFPLAGPKDAWSRLAKNLKAEIDEEKIEAFRGTVSLPFIPGKQIAVKIIDDRGIESLKIIKP